MKRIIFQFIFFIVGFSVFAENMNLMNARNFAEYGFWNEAIEELEKVPRLERNSDYELLMAFAKVMTNSASSKDEAYILKNASLENRLILLLKKENYSQVVSVLDSNSEKNLTSKEKYLIGLGFLGLGDYEKAEKFLGEDSVYGMFYTAYSQYVLGKTVEAYGTFSKVTKLYPAHKLGIEAHIYGAKCSIINKDYDLATREGLFAINKATDINQKVEAALLMANLYQDLGKPEEAINILKPLISSYDKRIVPLKFKLSEVYTSVKNIKDANLILEDVQNFFTGTDYAEEAAYRRGMLFLGDENFFEAKKHLSYCVNNFPRGKFVIPATYYDAFTTEKLAQLDEAVLLYTKIISLYKNTTYEFYSHERLAYLFYDQGEYQRALDSINYMQENYPKESAFSTVNNLKPQIELLLTGENKDVVFLIQQWNENKKNTTTKGMEIGLELAGKYLLSSEDSVKGVEILKDILSKIDENTTSYEKAKIAAEANNLMALYNCINAEYVFGSEYYLKAASFYMGISDDMAAESMYKAALALSNAKKSGDVRLVCNKMKTLYRNSPWTEKAILLMTK